MLSNPKLNPTLLKRDQVFSARTLKQTGGNNPLSKTNPITPAKKQRTKSTRIKRKSLSTQQASQQACETGKSALNEKESCHRDSFAKLIREGPITEAHMSNKNQRQQTHEIEVRTEQKPHQHFHQPQHSTVTATASFSNYQTREERPQQ